MSETGHSRRSDRRPTTSDLLRLADILRRTMTAFQRRLAGVARKLDQQQLLEPLGADVRVVVHLRRHYHARVYYAGQRKLYCDVVEPRRLVGDAFGQLVRAVAGIERGLLLVRPKMATLIVNKLPKFGGVPRLTLPFSELFGHCTRETVAVWRLSRNDPTAIQ
jgi:hypothetical protein